MDKIASLINNNFKSKSTVLYIHNFIKDSKIRERLILEPYYQRRRVWDNDKSTYFIESILLGTEIPPVVLIKNMNNRIEVNDGRQRIETIIMFIEDNLTLTKNGLHVLNGLARKKFSDLPEMIKKRFLSNTIRVIEFEVINKNIISEADEDKIKKEIFRRYNAGIIPLKKNDINRAKYDKDDLNKIVKSAILTNKNNFGKIFSNLFYNNKDYKKNVENLLEKFRMLITVGRIPVKYYAKSNQRKEITRLMYEIIIDEVDDINSIYINFIEKMKIVEEIKEIFVNEGYECNTLICEGIIWVLHVLQCEEYNINENKQEFCYELIKYIKNGIGLFSVNQSHFYKKYEDRYEYLLKYLEKILNKNIRNKYFETRKFRETFKKELLKSQDETLIYEIENAKVEKAQAQSLRIDDLQYMINEKKLLIRPTYQREEAININKSSSLIESIILGIEIPPIFLYEREDGIVEVIDGQQRLLSILGYLGKSYYDINGNIEYSKKNEYKLNNLSVLKNINGKRFADLDEDYKSKIEEFIIPMVVIKESLSPNFDPIDLFIRLNSKQYPIDENSFEMYNSYIDRNIVLSIREIVSQNKWMYFRKNDKRMNNEDIFTLYTYIAYNEIYNNLSYKDIIDIFQQANMVIFRFPNKKNTTKMLELSLDSHDYNIRIMNSIQIVKRFVEKVKLILLADTDEKNVNLEKELNYVFCSKGGKRTLQEFYLLWYIVESVDRDIIVKYSKEIKNDCRHIFKLKKTISINILEEFYEAVDMFFKKYSEKNKSNSFCGRQIELYTE